jgi:hypothetical protein
MTWHTLEHSTFSPELEAESLQTFCLDTYLSELAKLNPIPETSCSPGNETDSCQSSPSGTTYAPLMESPGEDQLMFFAGGFLARIFPRLEKTTTLTEKSQVLTGNTLDYGLRLSELWRKCGLNLSLWKTPKICELKDCTPSSKTLTAWGITQDGVCLGLGTLEQTTGGTECGYLPTPTSHNSKEGAYPAEFTRKTPTLSAQVGGKLNPTWNESRMGWPPGWTQIGENGSRPLGTDKMQEWLHSHSVFSQKD